MTARLRERDVELLRRPDVLVYVGTTNEDGSPHVAPLWSDADLDRNLVIVNTADGRRKVRNIRRDPRVALAAHAPERLHPPLLIEGTVVRISDEGADEHMDGLSMRYEGEHWTPVRGQIRVIVEIRPDRVLRST